MPNILFFAGSARKDSINKKLAAYAADMARDAGAASATVIDLADFTMPIYDGDAEAESGLPENARKLKKLFVEHDGFFIASPEYNSSFSPLLKNALDWISRPHEENEPSLYAFNGKAAAIGAVSPGAMGGLRGLVPLRMMLGNIGVTVVTGQVAVSNGFEAFDEQGRLKDAGQKQMLQGAIDQLLRTAQK